jgi:dTMP kinase
MQANRYRGKLIVFEGLDGSGQTTQAQLLAKWFFEKRDQLAYYTKEPSDGPVGALLKLALSRRLMSPGDHGESKPLDPVTMALFFAADRVDHVLNEIDPKLRDGIHVITDRYVLSSLAYQSMNVDHNWIKEINREAIRPDLTMFLDVPPRVCVQRMSAQRWHVELYEDLANLERVHKQYHEMIRVLTLEGDRIEVIDGNQPPAEVHGAIVAKTKAFLKSVLVVENDKSDKSPKDQLTLLMNTKPLSEGEIATHQEG